MTTRTITITTDEYIKLLECRVKLDILRDFLEEDSYVTKERIDMIIGKPENEMKPISGAENDDF